MKYLFTFLICALLISVSSCERKDFTTSPSSGKLQFSKDTVYLDTVFTNIGSATYNLKVYNRGSNAITIPKIQLENGTNSNYRLNVDGIPGKEFTNIDILEKDSIFIFIETTINAGNIVDPLYTDKILFGNGDTQQDVDLVTLVQDANFIFPGRDAVTMEIDSLVLNDEKYARGRFLTDNELIFTNAKPTVIYGFAAVPANKTLTIEAGSKVHFHDNSGLIIDNKATLKVNGTLEEKVVFEGDRLEHSFSETAGQWGTIWLRAGSKENEIYHAKIKNGIIGILVDGYEDISTTTLKIENTEIYNHSVAGLFGRITNIEGSNLVIGNAGQYSLAATIGGVYNFTHCTFANFWNNSLRQTETVFVNNYLIYKNEDKEEVIEVANLKSANFTNCIFDGNNNIEFRLDKLDGGEFNYNISNSMIKFNDTNDSYKDVLEMDFTSSFYQDIILNGKSHFRDTQKNDFIIGEESDAINKAKSTPFSTDILGVDRSTTPDIGAYQHITFEKEE
ncbi:hypothetical protein [Polaribacter sp. Hel1_85]|uniref:hypothetical protein n=1 Tax=Polaribacter sp. Hel1_85 TaxID=1250005 RepID=UPI00052E42F6|nr:hypothetical protein [Polaribacter sp. Hel1_85]KGL64243.1 hypothetical protein PHEL85_1295 [Polaribacter sp. Hel1_85]